MKDREKANVSAEREEKRREGVNKAATASHY